MSTTECTLFTATDAETVRRLVNSGHDVNMRNAEGRYPLHEAKNVQVAKALLEAGAEINCRSEDFHITPLHMACSSENNLELVKFLLEQGGADPNAVNLNGSTSLMYCTDPTITEVLLKAGADPNHKLYDGSPTFFHYTCPKIMQLYINAGADIKNLKDEGGCTILFYNHDEGVIRMLLNAGADPNAKDDLGYSPLHERFTTSYDNPSTIEELVYHGANVKCIQEQKNSRAMWKAVENGIKRRTTRNMRKFRAVAKMALMGISHRRKWFKPPHGKGYLKALASFKNKTKN